jgi:hypothetical protein
MQKAKQRAQKLLRGNKEREKGQKQQRYPDAPVNNVM